MAFTNIDNPELYFQAKLYSGNASTNAITLDGSENMRPDWLWIKCRSHADSSQLFDVLRGTNALRSDDTHADADASSNGFTSFDSDGFTLNGSNGGGNVNNSGRTYVAWNWNANGSGSSNSDGSITSSVSANTTAGFSIVSYTGSNANSNVGTVGHGLGAAPKMLIIKDRDAGDSDWIIFHGDIGTNKQLDLNNNGAEVTNTNTWNNTAPASSVFTIGNNSYVNNNGNDFIAYCFVEKQGYSKFGQYSGNGSNDGTYVYTGFSPSWVMTKRNDSTQNWEIYDNKRDSFNEPDGRLRANLNNAEDDQTGCDFLSNGFKWRNNNDSKNTSSATYIYMAFAESPFVNSNGVPTNAR